MTQRKQFYHGSIVKDLNVVLANAKSHVDRSNVAYFTTDRVYALICCRSREENSLPWDSGMASNTTMNDFLIN